MITELPWTWVRWDSSMVELSTVDKELEKVVLWCSKCNSCAEKNNDERFPCGFPQKEDAEFILKACNNYHELVKAAKELYNPNGNVSKEQLKELLTKLNEL